jgi:hypothetical protein
MSWLRQPSLVQMLRDFDVDSPFAKLLISIVHSDPHFLSWLRLGQSRESSAGIVLRRWPTGQEADLDGTVAMHAVKLPTEPVSGPKPCAW